jgi:uncharacterized membrane protein
VGGLRTQDISDLVVSVTGKPRQGLEPFERKVLDAVVYATRGQDRFHLTDFRKEIKAHPSHYEKVFEGFKKSVGSALEQRGWWIGSGLRPAGRACAAAWLITILGIVLAVLAPRPAFGVPWTTVLAGITAFVALGNAIVLTVFVALRKGWERRSKEGAEAAERWAAFRRFLTDFAGMKEAVPGSIDIWEQYLCYGIAFGIADRVLAAAQLHAPP